MPAAPHDSLIPQVTGRLAGTEQNVINAVRAGTPYRITICLDSTIALAAVRAAAADNRDFSNFLTVALLEYCGQRTAPATELIEFTAKLQAAYAASPRILAELEKFIRTKLRAKTAA